MEERLGPWIARGRTILYLDPQYSETFEYDSAEAWQVACFVVALMCLMIAGIAFGLAIT